MKKRLIKHLIIISVILLITSQSYVLAIEPRATNYIESQSSSIARTTGTSFDIYFSVTANQMLDEIGAFMIQLSKSTDQVTWTRAEVFYSYDIPEMLRENAWTHSYTISYTAQRGYYYRANIVFYAKDGTETERTSMYTNTIFIPHSGNGGRINE